MVRCSPGTNDAAIARFERRSRMPTAAKGIAMRSNVA
jgi:hypothetical protein